MLAFELLDDRAMLLVFPNTFEYFFIVYALIALRWEPSHWSPRFWLWTAAALWVCVKLPQEYWIHIAQRDFTETVADYPWFGVACALGLVVLGALFHFVARPRMPAPEHALRLAAAPIPERPSRRTTWDWTDFVEKTVLLALLSMIFAAHPPGRGHVRHGHRRRRRADRRREHRDQPALGATWEFGALLVTNLGLIYVLSRFFTDAENFPLGTALFFAFLISLLISLYDRYKPIYEARFPGTGLEWTFRRPVSSGA